MGCEWGVATCEAAAEGNQLEVLKWLRDTECPWNARTFIAAAKIGSIPILEWLFEAGCDLNWEVLLAASLASNLELLNWLISKGVSTGWDALRELTLNIGKVAVYNLICELEGEEPLGPDAYLLMSGDLQVFKRYIESRDHLPMLEMAAELGHLHWLKAAKDLSTDGWQNPKLCECSVAGLSNVVFPSSSNLEMLQWLRGIGCPWEVEQVARAAAITGDPKTMDWLLANGCPWSSEALPLAAQYGNLDFVKFAVNVGYTVGIAEICTSAATPHPSFSLDLRKKLEVLRWAHKQGFPWNEDTSLQASRLADLSLFKWAIKNGCPWNKQTILQEFLLKGNLEKIAFFLHEKGMEGETEEQYFSEIVKTARQAGSYELWKWLVEKGADTEAEDSLDPRIRRLLSK
jgi:hypothetical protein